MSKSKLKITKDTIIGEVLKVYPESSKVFRKYFAGGCFGCPSVNLESLAMAANMHRIDIDELISAIKDSVKN